MGVEVIYVVRHGYRMNWTVNPSTGVYSTTTPTPTGIPCDPELASYGVSQSHQLARHLVSLDPEIDVIYCSPFYRCLQTLKPTFELLIENEKAVNSVRVDNGIGEFFGAARFNHPSPPSLEVLHKHFDFLNATHEPSIVPHRNGETLEQLHARTAYAMQKIISEVDAEPGGPRSILIGTHAASMICIGRVLTGHMPKDPSEEDFRCGTCALSKYVRRTPSENTDCEPAVEKWNPEKPDRIPFIDWKNGKGIKGGWDCVWNGDCSFLDGGEERTWYVTFSFVQNCMFFLCTCATFAGAFYLIKRRLEPKKNSFSGGVRPRNGQGNGSQPADGSIGADSVQYNASNFAGCWCFRYKSRW